MRLCSFKPQLLLRPGGNPSQVETGGKERGKSGKSSSSWGDLMARVLEKGLSQSQPPSEMLPYMMMSMMLEQQQAKSKKKKKSKDDGRSDSWSAPGGSSQDTDDDDEDLRESSGMKAVANLNRMHRRVKRHPCRICAEFEQEVVEEMGVIEGQSWTLRDWLKRQHGAKFKGIYRCAVSWCRI